MKVSYGFLLYLIVGAGVIRKLKAHELYFVSCDEYFESLEFVTHEDMSNLDCHLEIALELSKSSLFDDLILAFGEIGKVLYFDDKNEIALQLFNHLFPSVVKLWYLEGYMTFYSYLRDNHPISNDVFSSAYEVLLTQVNGTYDNIKSFHRTHLTDFKQIYENIFEDEKTILEEKYLLFLFWLETQNIIYSDNLRPFSPNLDIKSIPIAKIDYLDSLTEKLLIDKDPREARDFLIKCVVYSRKVDLEEVINGMNFCVESVRRDHNYLKAGLIIPLVQLQLDVIIKNAEEIKKIVVLSDFSDMEESFPIITNGTTIFLEVLLN